MNELDTYIPPNIRLITRSLSGSHTKKIHSRWAAYLGRAESGPSAKINCLFSHRHIFGLFLVFQSSFQLHFSLPTFIPRHLRFAFWGSVCNWHSLNTNYYGTTFGGVPGSFNSDQIDCMCSQNRHRFKVPFKPHLIKSYGIRSLTIEIYQIIPNLTKNLVVLCCYWPMLKWNLQYKSGVTMLNFDL